LADVSLIPTAELDLRQLRSLLRDANNSPYQIETVFEEKCFDGGAEGEPLHLVSRDGDSLDGIAVVCGSHLRILAVRRAARRRGVGSALLESATEVMRARGIKRMTVAAEPGNYFVPGVELGDRATQGFFRNRGFTETHLAINLEADLRDATADDAPRSDISISRASSDDRSEISDYITREFGRLWMFEVSSAFTRKRPPLFIARRAREIIGFSAHDVNNRGLGFYGPAGVTKSVRGGGIGAALLRASLADLAAAGYERVVIPWVSSIEFYEKVAGARESHRFSIFESDL
jgi:GNAT superfamily N-acetyltransferase